MPTNRNNNITNNSNNNKKWTVQSALDCPPVSTPALENASFLLHKIPLRRDFHKQRQKREDQEEAQCEEQVQQWQQDMINRVLTELAGTGIHFKYAAKLSKR